MQIGVDSDPRVVKDKGAAQGIAVDQAEQEKQADQAEIFEIAGAAWLNRERCHLAGLSLGRGMALFLTFFFRAIDLFSFGPPGWVENITGVAHPDIRRIVPVFLKKVIPLLEILPKLVTAVVPLPGQILHGGLDNELFDMKRTAPNPAAKTGG